MVLVSTEIEPSVAATSTVTGLFMVGFDLDA
jgi:hypothetical protein